MPSVNDWMARAARQIREDIGRGRVDRIAAVISIHAGEQVEQARREEKVDHPAHYGGAEDPYEAIKVIEAWGLNFSLGSVLKYICRRDKKGFEIEDLKKARRYLDYEIDRLSR
jgi:hypothetical protein